MSSPFASHATPAGNRINWLKHAAFTVLVLLGLIFWIPALLRATVGESEPVAGSLDESARGKDASSIAERTDADTKPGGADADWLPTVERPRSPADCLVLTTTILGKSRRAAIVNGRLHREGDRILAAGELFQLTNVAEDRIELLREGADVAGDRHVTIRLSSQCRSIQSASIPSGQIPSGQTAYSPTQHETTR